MLVSNPRRSYPALDGYKNYPLKDAIQRARAQTDCAALPDSSPAVGFLYYTGEITFSQNPKTLSP